MADLGSRSLLRVPGTSAAGDLQFRRTAALFVADAAFLRHPQCPYAGRANLPAIFLFPRVIGRSLDEAIRARPACSKPNESWGIAEKFPTKGLCPVLQSAISRWTAPKYGKNANVCSGNDRSLFLLRREEGMGRAWCSGYLAVIPSYCPISGAECDVGLAMVRKLQFNLDSDGLGTNRNSKNVGWYGCPESFACPREEVLPKGIVSNLSGMVPAFFLPIR